MILIDTNVISELMRANPALAVLDWFGRQEASTLHLSAVGEAELRRGAAILPEGKRRDRLIAEIDAMVEEDFAGRVLPFDSEAAVAFAAIFADRRVAGRTRFRILAQYLGVQPWDRNRRHSRGMGRRPSRPQCDRSRGRWDLGLRTCYRCRHPLGRR